MENKEENIIYRGGEVMRILGIKHRTTLYRYQAKNLLPMRRVGDKGKYIFYPEDIENFKASLNFRSTKLG